ncbi:IS1595 family transposase ISSsu9 [bioreactor metagenome]|uniref:dihydrofolate reductase n=1 Tax=bioreactor metagenome TaxID=1076179 RepID=A0A644XIP0_9ZZZZ|nr:dihydrofolate reductase [Bacteroidales bacterium]MBP9977667.1 dihydrofolate reductase [Bacteroidales bacterium]
MISIIVAVADNLAIGKDNNLLWHISEDLKYFKRITGGHTVIMGRKTWESIGRPLPNRRNIVISRSLKVDSLAGAEVFGSLESALATLPANEEHFIIGGGEIYREALPLAEKLYITFVHITVNDADTFFPEVEEREWREVGRESFERGEKFGRPFEFVVLERRR